MSIKTFWDVMAATGLLSLWRLRQPLESGSRYENLL